MRYLSPVFLIAIFLLSSSCSDNNIEIVEEEKYEIMVPAESQTIFSHGITFDMSPNAKDIGFVPSHAWTAEITDAKSSAWLNIQPTRGNGGNVVMTISVTKNDTYYERSALVSIRCGTVYKYFSVKQYGRSLNDVSVEELMSGPRLMIYHNAAVMSAPVLSGSKDNIIHWENGLNELYYSGITHTYSSEGEHSIILQTNESSGCTFRTLEGITHIDFSNF